LPLKIIVSDRIGGKLDENFLLAPNQNQREKFPTFSRGKKVPSIKKPVPTIYHIYPVKEK
jgi:hypothetical protein